MQIKRISILNEFQCTGADCPFNCCRGWKIPIDNDMYMKYLQEKGIFGVLLRCSIEKKDELTAFRSTLHGCPFWGLDHLCTMQKKYGTAYMPTVCIQFPRQLYNLGFFCEETLYLACPESARLFLVSVAKNTPFDFAVTQDNVSYEVNTTNDDKNFLDYLLKSRDELISMLRAGTRFDSMAFVQYGKDAQNACLAQRPLPSPLDYDPSGQYSINSRQLNILFYNGFYHSSLRTISPFLYRLCKKYTRSFRILAQSNPAAADRKLADLKMSLYQKMPDFDKLLNRYYEYHLYTDFFDIYEDYSFSKHLLYGIAKAHMLWVFFALYARNKKQIRTKEAALIIAVYERRAPQIEDALKLL